MTDKKLKDDLELEANDGTIIKMGELRKFIKVEKLSPLDLFDKYDLLADSTVKEAIEDEVGFELEYRDKQAEEELNEQLGKEIDEEEDYDLGLPYQKPPSKPQTEKKPDKEKKPLEGDEPDLLPGGDSEPKESSSENSESEDPLLPS